MSRPKILLVENSSIVLQIEKRYLKDAGVSIFTAAGGEEALRIVRKIRPDLVFLSYNLPDTDGATCCRMLKGDPDLADIPVVMVCGSVGEEPALCRVAGCNAVIGKPVDRREFLETWRSFLGQMTRKEERLPCRATAACCLADATFYGTIEDISVNGMFVGTTCSVAPGSLMTMKFILPWSGASLIETGAQVVWVNSGKRRRNNQLPPGFGVIFHEMNGDAVEQIMDYLELIRLRLRQ